MSKDSYPPAMVHGGIEKIAEDVFMVRGSVQISALIRFSRNMTIVRHQGELSLINPIRLNAKGEEELRALGEVKHIIRTGCMHGMDDPYYVDTFKARFWSQPGGTTYTEPTIDVEMDANTVLPFPDAELFCYAGILQPESALLLKRGGGLLISCDAIQHYGDYKYNNLMAKIMMPFIGFPKTTLIGPFWLKLMVPKGESLRFEFERLLDLEFDALLGAHGSFLASGAKESVRKALDKTYG